MKWFVSSREKRLWAWTLAVIIAIYSTLGLSGEALVFLENRTFVDMAFVLALILIAVAIGFHGIRSNPGKVETVVWVGVFAVYLLMFMRVNIPSERSHIIEYSVLALLIYEVLKERWGDKKTSSSALIAILLSSLFGVLDECIQLFLPFRVFDLEDMLFNFLASVLAVGSSWVLSRVRKKFN